MKMSLGLVLILIVSACTKEKIIVPPYQVKDKLYLALGDSYTTGEGVNHQDSFPYQLVDRLNRSGVKTLEPEIVAFQGWTTTDLIRGIEQKTITKKYDFVTLLIGVNNQFSKLSPEIYRTEFRKLVVFAKEHSFNGGSTVYVISIPDWSVTPYGRSRKDYELMPADIDKFNNINREEALSENVHYIDITTRSRFALTDKTLLSIDSLHPSPKFYKEWVDVLHPLVRSELYF